MPVSFSAIGIESDRFTIAANCLLVISLSVLGQALINVGFN